MLPNPHSITHSAVSAISCRNMFIQLGLNCKTIEPINMNNRYHACFRRLLTERLRPLHTSGRGDTGTGHCRFKSQLSHLRSM